jgi:ATP-dependent helicase/nuclease subunit B
MLESGDLAAPPGFEEVSGTALARRLRRLRVGWGRARYLSIIDQAIAVAAGPAEVVDEADPEAVELRRERERHELAALRALLSRLLAATPQPDTGGRHGRAPGTRTVASDAQGRTSPAAIAGGVLAFLQLIPASGGMAESTMRKVLGDRLTRIRETLTRQTAWDAAVAILRTHLVTRIAPPGEGGLAPWTSTGGNLYLSDLATGGLSLRPHIFVVGMDAARVAGASRTDPLLTDADRQAVASVVSDPVAPIATSGERNAEARHALAATLARLRGKITLSYSAWESAEGRSISAAPELLQALRLREGDETLTYAELRREMGSLAGAVPTGAGLLDGDDVWLDAIADGRVLRSGTGVVRSVFPGLDAGLRARDARRSDQVTEYDGVIAPRRELDPLAADAVFSASRLETLGTCPRRYFYQYVLGIMPVGDPEYDPDVWLNAMQRGSLLHAIYERALSEARRRGIDYADEAFSDLALEAFEVEAKQVLREIPPPSQAVHDLERTDLQEEVRTWVEMIRQDRPNWVDVELRFGPGERKVEISAGGEPMRVRGAIDRVDRLSGGGLRIVDYKTGSFSRYRQRQPFAGGRRIQHVLYTLAAEQLLGEPVEVMEYHFPTRKGQMRRISYGDEALERGAQVLRTLLEMASSGNFVATNEPRDCRYCDFADVCRVTAGSFSSVTSERATWSRNVGMELPEYSLLAALRGIDE